MNALFIVYPVRSHYNMIISLAEEMKGRGYKIYVTGVKEHQKYIEESGLIFYNFDYYRRIKFKRLSSYFWLFASLSLNKRRRLGRYKNILLLEKNVRKAVVSTFATHIYIDAHFSFYSVFLNNSYDVTVFNTKLRSDKQKSVAPLYCYYKPLSPQLDFLFSKIFWLIHKIKLFFSDNSNHIIFVGTDELSLLKIYCQKHNVVFDQFFLNNNITSFYLEINPVYSFVKSIYIIPNSFDYSWVIYNDTYRYAYTLCNKQNLIVNNYEIINFVKNYHKYKKFSPQLKLIYCSVGTNSAHHSKKVVSLFSKLVNACQQCEDYYLVISTGDVMFSANNLSERTLLVSYTDQLYMIENCDLFITHGGLNSINESIKYKKPMIVFPIDEKFDQPGNSSRVVHNKQGLRGSVNMINSRSLLRKIEKSLNIKY